MVKNYNEKFDLFRTIKFINTLIFDFGGTRKDVSF